ncbi:hypothetical protein PoB_004068000 [Plakobranchus ocellatus]|uniref:Uncharacterized protein n=1 Tax=Plakobranchus ocellatus TaxID=259542 RepID=A0AAV4B546_9GAST|nr:hypothetical protein PoB_004068000 [Plakobranchus ocellatus]
MQVASGWDGTGHLSYNWPCHLVNILLCIDLGARSKSRPKQFKTAANGCRVPGSSYMLCDIPLLCSFLTCSLQLELRVDVHCRLPLDLNQGERDGSEH